MWRGGGALVMVMDVVVVVMVWVVSSQPCNTNKQGSEGVICWHGGGGGQPTVKKGTEGIIAPNSHILPDTPPWPLVGNIRH